MKEIDEAQKLRYALANESRFLKWSTKEPWFTALRLLRTVVAALKSLDSRLTALEAHRHDFTPTKTQVFESCEGCANDKCLLVPGQVVAVDPKTRIPSCYVYRTCGECARAFRRDDSFIAVCGSGPQWKDHPLDHECNTGDFKAVKR